MNRFKAPASQRRVKTSFILENYGNNTAEGRFDAIFSFGLDTRRNDYEPSEHVSPCKPVMLQ